MTKEEQQERITLNDHVVIHKVTDTVLAMHKDGTEIYAVDVIKKPLVMCKDCRWYRDYDGCFFSTAEINADDFCSYGERKE